MRCYAGRRDKARDFLIVNFFKSPCACCSITGLKEVGVE